MPRQPELFDEDAGRSAWAATTPFDDYVANAPYEVVQEFLSSRPGSKQPWTAVPASEINRLWAEYAKWGYVRDHEALARVIEQFKENVAKLDANSALSGHQNFSPGYEDSGLDEDDEQQMERFYTWVREISDYGTGPLVYLASSLDDAKTAEEALLILDKMLNVAHPSGDLSAILVEGGARTLDQLFSQEGPTPSFQGAMRAETVPAFAGSSGGNERNEIPEALDPPSAWISNPAEPEVSDPVERPSIFWPKTKMSGWLGRAKAMEPRFGD